MPQKIHGVSSAHQNLTENIQYYIVFTKSPKAYTDPVNAAGVDIAVTKNYQDISQKNFDVLLMSVGLRAMPVIMNDPCAVLDLAAVDAPSLFGEGYMWKFAVERADYFQNTGPGGTISEVGFLVDELNGIVLPNGVVLETTGVTKNIEFVREDLWRECDRPVVAQRNTPVAPPICDKRITYSVGKKGK